MKKIITTFFLTTILVLMSIGSFAAVLPSGNVQTGYRWRNDDGNQATATYTAPLNTSIIQSDIDRLLRLRIILENSSIASDIPDGSYTSNLQYSKDSVTWTTIDGDRTKAFYFADSSEFVTSGISTTQQISSSPYTFYPGMIYATPSFTTSSYSLGSVSEYEFLIKAGEAIENHTLYYFRISGIGVIDVHNICPKLNTEFIFEDCLTGFSPVEISISSNSGPGGAPLSFSNLSLITSSGLLYQWQSSPDTTTGWSNIYGADSVNWNTLADRTIDTLFYRLAFICPSTTDTQYSNTVSYITNTDILPVHHETIIYHTCEAVLYDNGGYGVYANNSNDVVTIYPTTLGAKSQYNISYLTLDYSDTLFIYGGNSTDAPLLNFYTHFGASDVGVVYTSPSFDGSLTFKFVSNETGSLSGYAINITCDDITSISCPEITGLNSSIESHDSVIISWDLPSIIPPFGYDVYFSTSSAAPSHTEAAMLNTSSNSISLTELEDGTQYYVWVRSHCGDYYENGDWSNIMFSTPVINDDAINAINLSIGGSSDCVDIYKNSHASVSPDEPFASCVGAEGYNTVWFKFTSPSSGHVKITNDFAISELPMLSNSKIAVYSVTDPTDYSSFDIISCADNNGSVSVGKTTLYAMDLNPGEEYYISVSGISEIDTGKFCLKIQEFSNDHISTVNDCSDGKSISNFNSEYSGWISLIDNNDQLMAMIKANSFEGSGTYNIDASQFISSAIRVDSLGTPYLNRNFTINNSGNNITNADVRLFFLNSEFSDLDISSIDDLGVTKYDLNECASAIPSATTPELLYQTNNGNTEDIRWIDINTTGFSTFFLNEDLGPLSHNLGHLIAKNNGHTNTLVWTKISNNEIELIIERSHDGVNFTSIDNVKNNSSLTTQHYVDNSPLSGLNYYRIKAVDLNSAYKYSNVAVAEVMMSSILSVYPNPTKDVLYININTLGNNAQLTLTDIQGREIEKFSNINHTQLVISLEKYAQGTYFIQYSDDQKTQSFKVNKQ